MTGHLGLAACALDDPAVVMDNFRELRALDLRYAAAAGLRCVVVAKEILNLAFVDVMQVVKTELARGGVCNWCLKKDADKRCSACNAADFCSMECHRAAWKGDMIFPAHKLVCKK